MATHDPILFNRAAGRQWSCARMLPVRSALGVDAGMTRLTRLCRAVGVGLAVATATLGMTQMANAAPPQQGVPSDLVPGGVSQFLVAHAKGVQIYKCQSGTNGTFSWAFVEPRADLVGDNGQIIKHTVGPTWTAPADGSSVSRDPNIAVKSVSVTP